MLYLEQYHNHLIIKAYHVPIYMATNQLYGITTIHQFINIIYRQSVLQINSKTNKF